MSERIYRDPVHNIIRLRTDTDEGHLMVRLIDAREFQRRGLGSQRVGLAVQFLDQEVQALADLAALVHQTLDFVHV